jgi:hypothetical protein
MPALLPMQTLSGAVTDIIEGHDRRAGLLRLMALVVALAGVVAAVVEKWY